MGMELGVQRSLGMGLVVGRRLLPGHGQGPGADIDRTGMPTFVVVVVVGETPRAVQGKPVRSLKLRTGISKYKEAS